MRSQKHALLLVGSARQPHSTSASLGKYLLDQLEKHDFDTESILIHHSLKSDDGNRELLSATDRSDLLIVAFPLYVDSLPFQVIQIMEIIEQHRQTQKDGRTRE